MTEKPHPKLNMVVISRKRHNRIHDLAGIPIAGFRLGFSMFFLIFLARNFVGELAIISSCGYSELSFF